LKADSWNAFSKEEKEALISGYVDRVSELPGQVISQERKMNHDFFGGGFKYNAQLVWQLSPLIDGKVVWEIVVDGNGQIQRMTGTYFQNGDYNV
jgi:hypothetical protein